MKRKLCNVNHDLKNKRIKLQNLSVYNGPVTKQCSPKVVQFELQNNLRNVIFYYLFWLFVFQSRQGNLLSKHLDIFVSKSSTGTFE